MTDDAYKNLPKTVILLGPTASGKSDWGIRLAKAFDGEIISADSRQIYTKMDIGTAKEIGEWRWDGHKKTYYVDEVPHYLVDFLDPGQSFTVAEFRDLAIDRIQDITARGRKPLVVGGTGLYIQSLVDNFQIPRVPPNKQLRKSLEEKTEAQLMHLLKTLDEEAARTIDPHNKRRVIRALEVSILTGKPFSQHQKTGEPIFHTLQIGIALPRDVLHQRLEERVDTMMEKGLVREIQALLRQKYSWSLPSMSGVGYRQFRNYMEDRCSLEDAVARLKRDTRQFARRQMTWFKRDLRIQWVGSYDEAAHLVKEFLHA